MENIRIAWLFPSLGRGPTGYPWHPIFKQFTKLFPQTTIFTGRWPGFAPNYEGSFNVKNLDTFKKIGGTAMRYGQGLMYLSPNVIFPLLKFKPHVIFTNAFSAWTLLATIFKFIGGWKLIILYEGSSPNADFRHSKLRSTVRRLISRSADAFVTNNQAGKKYLTQFLGVEADRVFAKPYEVPTIELLLHKPQVDKLEQVELQKPVFLYVGQVIERKGITYLLEACDILKKQGYENYTLIVGGDGLQKEELEKFTRERNLENCVKWVGWVDYESLGTYFQAADIFVFPTLEDTWGMVILEAMLFGKAIISSRFAGASEMVLDGENGFLFDPTQIEELADIMRRFIDNPAIIQEMSQKSQQFISPHSVEEVSKSLSEVIDFVMKSPTSIAPQNQILT